MSQSEHLIHASEVARHNFCARALAYDRRFPPPRPSKGLRFFRVLVLPAIVSAIVSALIFSFIVSEVLVALVTFLGGVLLSFMLQLMMRRMERPNRMIVYQSTKAKRNREVLDARGFGLRGQPNYLLQTGSDKIPILSKKNPAPNQPHQAHILHVIAHCLLLAETSGNHPPFGVIRYGDGRTFEVDFDEDAIEWLSQTMDEIEEARHFGNLPPRNHEERRRCYACSQRQHCDQSLFP